MTEKNGTKDKSYELHQRNMTDRYYNGEDRYRSWTHRVHRRERNSGSSHNPDRQRRNSNHVTYDRSHRDEPPCVTSSSRRDSYSDHRRDRHRRRDDLDSFPYPVPSRRLDSRERRYSRSPRQRHSRPSPLLHRDSSSRSRDRSHVKDFSSGSENFTGFRYVDWRNDRHRRPRSTTSSSSPGGYRLSGNHHRRSSRSQDFPIRSNVPSRNTRTEAVVAPIGVDVECSRPAPTRIPTSSPDFDSTRDSSSDSMRNHDEVTAGVMESSPAEASHRSSRSFRNRFVVPRETTSQDSPARIQTSLLSVQSSETPSLTTIEAHSTSTKRNLILLPGANGDQIGHRSGIRSRVEISTVGSRHRQEVDQRRPTENQTGSAEASIASAQFDSSSKAPLAPPKDATEATTEAVISPVKESQVAKKLNVGGATSATSITSATSATSATRMSDVLSSLADSIQQKKITENGKKTIAAVRQTNVNLSISGKTGKTATFSSSNSDSLENNHGLTAAGTSVSSLKRVTRTAVQGVRERSSSASPNTRSPTPTAMTSDSGIDTFSGRDSSARETPSRTTSLSEQEMNDSTLAAASGTATPPDSGATTVVSEAPSQTESQIRNVKRPHPQSEKVGGPRPIMRCDGPGLSASTSASTKPVKTAEIRNSLVKSGPDEARRTVLLDYQNSAANFFRTSDKISVDSVLVEQAAAATRLKLLEPVSVAGDLFCDSPGTRSRGRPRVPSTNFDSLGRNSEFDASWENNSMNSFEVVPLKKFTTSDLTEMEIMTKKRRRVEVFVPDYRNQEPKRFTGMFHMKLVTEFQKQMANISKTEKKRTIPPFGKISHCDVINQLRNAQNSADVSDPLLRQVALYAVANHRKQENFLHIILVLIANGFDCNVRNENGDALLKLALLTEELSLIDVLLKHSRLENLDSDGNSALHVAAQIWAANPSSATSWDIVDLILSMEHKNSSLIFAKNKESKTALVSYLHHPEFIPSKMEEFLIAFIPNQIEQNSDSLLHLLAHARRLDLLVFCLSRYQFEPNRLDSDGRTFMHIFAQSAILSKADADTLTELARSVRASVTIPDKKGKTALDLAIGSGHTELVRLWKGLPEDELIDKEKGCLIRDIAFGKEAFPIRVVNEKSDRRMADFVYIKQNIYLGDAPRVKGSVACSCRVGQCSTTTCSCLKRGLGYSATGTIVPGTCKGNPIFECGSQCACGPNCGSRVVQRGLKYPLEIFMTAKRGWGVRTSRTIQPGEFIVEFVGEVVESDRLLARDPNNDWAMELTVDNYDGTMFHVDPTTCGNVARFLNHSCDPNLFPVRVYQSGDSVDTGVVMAMFSAQVIQKSHELTFHYGDAYWERQTERGIYCNCGTSKCKFAPPKITKKRTRT